MLTWLRKNDKGFTLVELIMVIVILGVLAGVAVPLVGNLKERAMLAKLGTIADSIGTAIVMDMATGGKFPVSGGEENEIDQEISALVSLNNIGNDIGVYVLDTGKAPADADVAVGTRDRANGLLVVQDGTAGAPKNSFKIYVYYDRKVLTGENSIKTFVY